MSVLIGPQITREAMVRSAHQFALALEAEKTDDDSINHAASQERSNDQDAFHVAARGNAVRVLPEPTREQGMVRDGA